MPVTIRSRSFRPACCSGPSTTTPAGLGPLAPLLESQATAALPDNSTAAHGTCADPGRHAARIDGRSTRSPRGDAVADLEIANIGRTRPRRGRSH